MTARRYFGEVVELVGVGAVIVRRDDGLGHVFTPAAEIAAGVPLHPGDRVEFCVLPFGAEVRGCDLILHAYTGDRQHRAARGIAGAVLSLLKKTAASDGR
jgi:hypothetical protein